MTILEQRFYECFIRFALSFPEQMENLNKNLNTLNGNIEKLLETDNHFLGK